MNPIPTAWLDKCGMKRIILHWTCGRRVSNSTDREHYHLLVEHSYAGLPRIIRGDHTIADNVRTGDGDYAAHVKGINTASIGLALCGMLDCRETPFLPGTDPFTEAQWRMMCQAAAQLCKFYGIPVTNKTVLAHGEVQANLGIAQSGKWDPMRLPWEPAMKPADVMLLTRKTIAQELAKL